MREELKELENCILEVSKTNKCLNKISGNMEVRSTSDSTQ